MTYKTDLQTNNTNLQSILDAVNALPEAGSGSTNNKTAKIYSVLSEDSSCDIRYLDKDGNLCVNGLNSFELLEVPIPSLVALIGNSIFRPSGDGYYIVSKDCSFICNMNDQIDVIHFDNEDNYIRFGYKASDNEPE